ncbi:MAG: tetratricopeptide repeat protein [Flavobacteriales bacterium]
MAKKNNKTEEQFAAVEETLTNTEQWVENNQALLMKVVFSVVGVIAIVLGYTKFVTEPKNNEAQSELFMAVNSFEKDSFNLALNGDGQFYGFLDLIDEYGSTEAGNLANFYAGSCYLNLGDFDNAIEYLSKFKANDQLVSSVALGSLGDAYMNVGESNKAINSWKKAASNSDNNFTAPLYMMRAAMALEENGNFKEALSLYKNIKNNYSDSDQGRDIDKYITRVSLK